MQWSQYKPHIRWYQVLTNSLPFPESMSVRGMEAWFPIRFDLMPTRVAVYVPFCVFFDRHSTPRMKHCNVLNASQNSHGL